MTNPRQESDAPGRDGRALSDAAGVARWLSKGRCLPLSLRPNKNPASSAGFNH